MAEQMSSEAEEVVKLYREALNASTEERAEELALAFVRKMSAIVEPNSADPKAEKKWQEGAKKQIRHMIFENANRAIKVGSGTGGCSIRFDNKHPETEKSGEYMSYIKPLGENWEYGGKYWKNFIKHFKTEVVNFKIEKSKKKWQNQKKPND